MSIGIIVYSKTGNTLSVAQALQQRLAAGGQAAAVEQITLENENEGDPQKVRFSHNPSPLPYDVLLLGAPVQAFRLCQAMKLYLAGLDSLAGKQVGCFVTQHLSRDWMGGNKALRQMAQEVARLGGQPPYAQGIVHWKDPQQRQAQINQLLDAFCTPLQKKA